MAAYTIRMMLFHRNFARKLSGTIKCIGNGYSFSKCKNLLIKYKIDGVRQLSSDVTSLKTEINESNAKQSALLLSENCIQRLKAIQNDDECLRVSVDGGGCSGFQYTFTMDSNVAPDDCVIAWDGVRVVVDHTSLEFIRGATVDYQQELIRASFRVVSNPRAEQGCSCGASFSVKL